MNKRLGEHSTVQTVDVDEGQYQRGWFAPLKLPKHHAVVISCTFSVCELRTKQVSFGLFQVRCLTLC